MLDFSNKIKMNSATEYDYDNPIFKYENINIMMLSAFTIIILLYYVLFNFLGDNNVKQVKSSSKSLTLLELVLWSLFIVLIIINSIQYFYGINVSAEIKNFFIGEPEVDIKIETDHVEETVPEIKTAPQVYNIKKNIYNYDDARAICKAFGARLATTDDIYKAHKGGGDWCNYGWSEGQMALYPTQKETWKKLQKIKGHEHDCGRPGVNGGFIANKNIKFGVNCFGYKPKITDKELNMMGTMTQFPKSNSEKEFDKKVEMWKKKLSDMVLLPFNRDRWSEI